MSTEIDGRESCAKAAQLRASERNELDELRTINFALVTALKAMVAPRVGTKQQKAIQLAAARQSARAALALALKSSA